MEDTKPFGGFSAVFDTIGGNIQGKKVANLDPNPDDDIDDLKNDDQIDTDDDNKGDVDNIDTSDDIDDTNNGDGTDDNETKEDDENDNNESEEENVSLFFDAIAEQFGWEIEEDEEKPKTVEDFISYISDVIEENSEPEFASEEIKELNEFVAQGGDLYKYFQETSTDLDYDSIDLENEETQKRVIREFLTEQGLSDKSIDKKILKYEDAGILSDEAQDAAEQMKNITEKKKQQLLEEQKKQYETYQQQQQIFYNNVIKEIEDIQDIRGIKIPKEDKKTLINYIFKVEADGTTKYQKDYSKSVKNLIESAYFTMKGDKLINSAKAAGETTAVKKLKNTLASTKKGGSKQTINNRTATPLWELTSKQLRKPSR